DRRVHYSRRFVPCQAFYDRSTTKAGFLGTQPLSGLWGVTKFFSSPLFECFEIFKVVPGFLKSRDEQR
ncbi:MAG TPA: hypothetical protein VEL31_29990, partial [Ktedonobacteraceae bacterium]|nr:hypothetical protein [Ktedonobacteraceae bacterium]